MSEIWTYTPYDVREWNALHAKGDMLGILKLERAQYAWRDPYRHLSAEDWRSIYDINVKKHGEKALEESKQAGIAHQNRLKRIVEVLDKEIEECQMP